MAYVRKKKVKGREYHQLVETRRVEGKPRQRVLLHLGQYRTVDEALEGWSKEVETLRELARHEFEEVPEGADSVLAQRKPPRQSLDAEKRAYRLEMNLNPGRAEDEEGAPHPPPH